jgi:hypothetical protein
MIMKNLPIDQLSFVFGGLTRTGAVVDALTDRFGKYETTLIGKPHFGPNKNGIEQVSGTFAMNDLPLVGGRPQEGTFTAAYHPGLKTVTNLASDRWASPQ